MPLLRKNPFYKRPCYNHQQTSRECRGKDLKPPLIRAQAHTVGREKGEYFFPDVVLDVSRYASIPCGLRLRARLNIRQQFAYVEVEAIEEQLRVPGPSSPLCPGALR